MLLDAELARGSTAATTIYLPRLAIVPDPPQNQPHDRTHINANL